MKIYKLKGIAKILESMVKEMKLIENKKLLGKINIMDIMLLLVIFVVGIVAYKVVFKSETAVGIGAKYFTTTCTMKLDALPEGASNFLEVGTDVYDNETNTYIGKLVEAKSGDYLTIRPNRENNTFVASKTPNQESAYITVEVSVSDQGADLITADNYYIKVGKAVSVRSGNFAGSGFITTIAREEI